MAAELDSQSDLATGAGPSGARRSVEALGPLRGRERAALEKIGRYTVLGQIAGGGMGSVFLALMRGPAGFSRLVAIKCLHTRWLDDPKYIGRFATEVRLSTRIRHPNVVQTLDVVEEAGELFLVMEYVEGVTLAALLSDARRLERPLPAGFACSIVSAVLRGLHAAHEATDERGAPLHIVHRDVSPQNIMLSRAGHVQVLDFGAAKAIDHSQHTAAGVLVGKLAYMAPEQVRGERSSPRTDVFATGVVLWEALVGERLFYDPDLARGELLQSLVLKPIPRPSQLRPELPPRLDDVVQMALARNPRRRYQSAQEFAVALEACAEPVGAAELGRFVSEVCAARLADKESLLREGMLRAALEPSGPTPSSEQALVVPARPRGVVLARPHGPVGVRVSRWAWAGAAMVTALGIWWLGRLLLPPRTDTPSRDHLAVPVAPAASPAPRPAAYLEPEAAPEDVEPIAVEVTLPARTPPRAARSAHAAAREGRATVRPPAPGPAGVGVGRAAAQDTRCDPPTFMDAAGIRHFKKGCL